MERSSTYNNMLWVRSPKLNAGVRDETKVHYIPSSGPGKEPYNRQRRHSLPLGSSSML